MSKVSIAGQSCRHWVDLSFSVSNPFRYQRTQLGLRSLGKYTVSINHLEWPQVPGIEIHSSDRTFQRHEPAEAQVFLWSVQTLNTPKECMKERLCTHWEVKGKEFLLKIRVETRIKLLGNQIENSSGGLWKRWRHDGFQKLNVMRLLFLTTTCECTIMPK